MRQRRPSRSRFFGFLLRLLPADVRATFGPDMEQLYRDQLGDLAGPAARVRYRAAAAGDVIRTAGAEWTTRARGTGREEE